MEHNLGETVALLQRTPGALDALLRGLPEIWISRNEGEKTWNAREVVGHLIHGERTDWLPRARMIREFGEGRAFEPFDRWGHERESEGKALGEVLDEFARRRLPHDRAREARGYVHPRAAHDRRTRPAPQLDRGFLVGRLVGPQREGCRAHRSVSFSSMRRLRP